MLTRIRNLLGHLFHLLANAFGKNHIFTPKNVIIEQMNEPRSLPLGRQEFMVWSDRIIAGALIPYDSSTDENVYLDSIRYALANMILHLGPTESHKPDAYFIHSLRKHAINQVADTLRKELYEEVKKRTAANETAVQNSPNEVASKEASVSEDKAQVIEFKGKEGENV